MAPSCISPIPCIGGSSCTEKVSCPSKASLSSRIENETQVVSVMLDGGMVTVL